VTSWLRARRYAHPTSESLTLPSYDDREIEALRARYGTYIPPAIHYATVRDYVDSFEHLHHLATTQGDMKDVQRPWMFKAVTGVTPAGGRVLEIGGGQPYVSHLLARAGFEAWLVDPYDGPGSAEYAHYRQVCPEVRFIRAYFSDSLLELAPQSFDAVFSISVLEHLDLAALEQVLRGSERFARPSAVAVHAIDHVHRGHGDVEHLSKLRVIINRLGLRSSMLQETLAEADRDTETYFLSAESHNRWRGNLPYDAFPMRVCISIHTCSPVKGMRL
jgi:SAM-dependent methyltransferase